MWVALHELAQYIALMPSFGSDQVGDADPTRIPGAWAIQYTRNGHWKKDDGETEKRQQGEGRSKTYVPVANQPCSASSRREMLLGILTGHGQGHSGHLKGNV